MAASSNTNGVAASTLIVAPPLYQHRILPPSINHPPILPPHIYDASSLHHPLSHLLFHPVPLSHPLLQSPYHQFALVKKLLVHTFPIYTLQLVLLLMSPLLNQSPFPLLHNSYPAAVNTIHVCRTYSYSPKSYGQMK